ncbi:MAG: hypothetical protein IT438_06805 [Phycisphaerales bacterium]|nr:hypothetical protein [Phycisphaerales bacterium]
MRGSALQRRVAAIERKLVSVAARCDLCGGNGPGGLVFAIEPDEPKPPPPCPACGRSGDAMLVRITLAPSPTSNDRVPVG